MLRFTGSDALLIVNMALWGFNFVAIKLILRDVNPFAYVTVLTPLVILILVVIFYATHHRWTFRTADIGRWLIMGISGVAINILTLNIGVMYTAAGNASLLFTTAPIFGLLFAMALYHDRVSRRRWAGVFAALVGVALIIAGGKSELQFGLESLRGDLLILASAASWAVYSVVSRPVINVYTPLQFILYGWLISAPILLVSTAGPALAQPWGDVSALSWLMIAYTGLSMAIAALLFYRGVSKVGAIRSLIYMYMVPFFAVLFAAFLLQEALGALQIVGALMMLIGMTLALVVVETKSSPSTAAAAGSG